MPQHRTTHENVQLEIYKLTEIVYAKAIILPGKNQVNLFNDSVIRVQDLFDIIESMGYQTFDSLPM